MAFLETSCPCSHGYCFPICSPKRPTPNAVISALPLPRPGLLTLCGPTHTWSPCVLCHNPLTLTSRGPSPSLQGPSHAPSFQSASHTPSLQGPSSWHTHSCRLQWKTPTMSWTPRIPPRSRRTCWTRMKLPWCSWLNSCNDHYLTYWFRCSLAYDLFCCSSWLTHTAYAVAN